MENLWLLTEERPKPSVIKQIVQVYCNDFSDKITYQGEIKIRPIIRDGKFLFTYVVENLELEHIDKIYIRTVSGSSSFVDYLVFKQENTPADWNESDEPIMAVEETKTSDKESRNTGVYQRSIKFVYIMSYYPNVRMYMLYNEELGDTGNSRPSDTSIFGTNMLLTLGVKIIGKDTSDWFAPFNSLDELIEAKNGMSLPPSPKNVPIRITKDRGKIMISGRLSKPADAGNIGHDPNVGAISTISKCMRVLGWDGDIIITQHGVKQTYVNQKRSNNKFLYICQLLGLRLDGITMPMEALPRKQYWHYEMTSEKMSSILLHLLGLYYGLYGVYENHAGCERGYFYNKQGDQITIPKRNSEGVEIPLPDLILYDETTNYIVNVEAEKLVNLNNGINQMETFNIIEGEFVKPYYPGSTIYRCVCLFGGKKTNYSNESVLLYLSETGEICINENAPECIKRIFRAEGVKI